MQRSSVEAQIEKLSEFPRALIEIISPKVGSVEASDGTWVEGKQMLGAGPSVLYDAVAVLAPPGGAAFLNQR